MTKHAVSWAEKSNDNVCNNIVKVLEIKGFGVMGSFEVLKSPCDGRICADFKYE